MARVAEARAGVQCVWFKRDLRASDHRPLLEASRRGPVVALYVYEPRLLAAPDHAPRHLVFQNQCLAELDAALRARGGRLVYRVGAVVEVLEALRRQTGFTTLWSHQETGNGLTFERDRAVGDWAHAQGVVWIECVQNGVVRRLAERDGWARRWHRRAKRPVMPAPTRIEPVDVAAEGPRTLAELGLAASTATKAQPGGAQNAWRILDSFLTARGVDYRVDMSSPNAGWTGCSRLSPHLAWGSISFREVHQTLEARRAAVRADKSIDRRWGASLSSFAKRLRWRCHFAQKLESEPRLEFENLARAYDGVRDPIPDPARFEAFTTGRTGYPMVDACMRCLHTTGWLNFRMRAMVMSFAAYHLWLHWRPVSLLLARLFVDYDPGIHYAQCQMQSGTTAINTLRIYSPAKQAADHDPEGTFIHRWVPELAGVGTDWLAAPEHMPSAAQAQAGCVIGVDYPAPIVEHRAAVAHAKATLYAIRRRPAAKAEAQAIYEKHGSRRRPRKRRTALDDAPRAQVELPLGDATPASG